MLRIGGSRILLPRKSCSNRIVQGMGSLEAKQMWGVLLCSKTQGQVTWDMGRKCAVLNIIESILWVSRIPENTPNIPHAPKNKTSTGVLVGQTQILRPIPCAAKVRKASSLGRAAYWTTNGTANGAAH